MRICYECGKEITNPDEMVMKKFRVAEWGVRWTKPFHIECWRKRTKISRRKYAKACLAILLPICIAVAYWILTLR